MDLRKCECGGCEEVSHTSEGFWFVVCTGCLDSTFGLFTIEEQAIKEWNEGKVE